jgi:BirA family transcriptional regulator, biotin operon repressor / biotin---[acetyl-CoA-carboxylase] ligase
MSASVAELVLEHLREAPGSEAPAEDVAHKLGLGAAEVLSAIESLRQAGYEIGYVDNPRHRGFVLLREPAQPVAAELDRLLRTQAIGRHLVHREEVGSTNDLARELADEGAPHGTVVLADRQTSGRGRRGREWVSLPGANLYCSIVLRPALPPERAHELTLVAGVALAEALEGSGVAAQLKWPNDVEHEGRKLAGILSELHADEVGLHHVVVGIGVNVDVPAEAFPEELRTRATSVRAITGRPASCAQVAAALFDRLEEWLVLHESMGFGAVLDSWRARSSTLHGEVRALVDGQVIAGVAEDVDATGALLVRDAAGKQHRIVAGEVTTVRGG